MNIKAYHGTNQNITSQFKHGLDHKGVTSKYGYWFTDSIDEAKQYGKQSSNRMRSNAEDHDKLIDKYLKRIELAERKGNWDLYDKLTEEMEAIEFSDDDKSYYVYTVNLSLENPFVYEVGDEYFDQETVINHAIKKKYDSVIFKNISDSPYGGIGRTTQYVVFDPSDIKIVSKHKVDSDSITESFVGFVKSLDRGWNKSLIEAIVDGYNVIFESDMGSNSNMVFLHGGNLDDIQSMDDFNKWTKGRVEYGPGLYLTTHYGTATKYAKGSRKLYKIEVEKGTDINSVSLDYDTVLQFISTILSKPKQKEYIVHASRFVKDGKINASIFVNIFINSDLISSKNGSAIRKFLVDNGIDYEVVQNAFGWGETMLVLYNMKKIKNVQRVSPQDKSILDLPSINESIYNIDSPELEKAIHL